MTEIDAKLQKFIESLEEFDKKVLLPKIDGYDISEYMDLSVDKLKIMSDEDCGIAAVRLAQYNRFLQKEINKQNAIKNWADSNINSIIAEKNNEYDKFIKIDIKKFLIQKENSAAAKYYKIYSIALSRVDSLSYITGRIDTQVQTLLALQQSKRKYGGK